MASLFAPKIEAPAMTAEEKAAKTAAKEEKIGEAQERAGDETDRLFRLFGARSAFGMGGRIGVGR
jgi:hypothetical protein